MTEATENHGKPAWALVGLMLLFTLYGWMLFGNRIRHAGGADTSGYLNAARLLGTGTIVRECEGLSRLEWPPGEAHPFIPLGFSPGPAPGTKVPYYPPGVPIQFALVAELLGWKRGPFLVSPFAGVIAVILTFLIARKLGLELGYAITAATTLGLFPTFVFQALMPMSDVIATAWVCATILLALKSRDAAWWAYLAGAAFGISVLTRPTNGLLLVPLVFALPLRPSVLVRFVLGGLPFGAFFLIYNHVAFGSVFRMGYSHDLATHDLSPNYFVTRSRHYLYWLSALMTPFLPLGWLASGFDRCLTPRIRGLLLAWFGAFFFFFCFYRHYDAWWYTRFLLPGLPALTIGAVFAARDLGKLTVRAGGAVSDRMVLRTSAAIVALVVVVTTMVFHIGGFGVLELSDKTYRNACVIAPMRIPEHSYVFAMQASGAMTYYGGMTPINWDVIEPGQIRRLESVFQERGLWWYALLFDFEEPEFLAKFPGEWEMIERYDYITLWARKRE